MARLAYVNGQYVPISRASVSIQDRGFQFGDGIYIVIACVGGYLIDLQDHLNHLEKYLEQSFINFPVQRETLEPIFREVIRRNRIKTGSLYVQITRGNAKRRHAFPTPLPKSTLVIIPYQHSFNLDADSIDEVSIIFQDDLRWKHPFIKSTSLFPTVLLRQAAADKKAFECWLLDEKGKISEGASSNAFIVMRDGILRTRPDDGSLVPGVTRNRILKIAELLGIPVQLKAFTRNEFYAASEAFLTGATSMVKAVVRSGDWTIGSGNVGPVTQKLAAAYYEFCRLHGQQSQ